MSDGAHGGRADPWSAEERTWNVEHAQKDDIPVKAAAFFTLVHQDKPAIEILGQCKFMKQSIFCYLKL